MFTDTTSLVEYLYTDFICGTDSLSPEMVQNCITDHNMDKSEIRKLLREKLESTPDIEDVANMSILDEYLDHFLES